MKRFFILCCLINLYFIHPIYTQSAVSFPSKSLPLITTYLSEQYNGGIQNWDFDQDTLGFLYVANNFGLLEFDGAVWTRYEIPNSTKMRALAVEKETNNVFVGGQKQFGYFSRTVDGLMYTDLTNNVSPEVVFNEVWSILEYKQCIYANIGGSIVASTKGTLKLVEGIAGVTFLKVMDGKLIAGASDGVYSFDDASGLFVKRSASNGHKILGIIQQGDSCFVFTYDGEIFIEEEGVLSPVSASICGFLQTSKVNRVLKLQNGNIAIATQNNGLLILDGQLNPVQVLTKNRGLNHRTVVSLFEDHFNNLWIGLNNGICVAELKSPFSMINENIGLEGTGYSATSYKEDVYLGTSSGLFKWSNDAAGLTEPGSYTLVSGSEGLVNNVSVINDQLILSHHEGAFRLDGDRFIPFYSGTGAWKFAQSSDETLLGGTYTGFALFNRDANNAPKLVKPLSGLNESSRIFEYQNDSVLWMTHGYKGAFKVLFEGDSIKSVKHYGVEDGFPSNILISVYKVDGELIFTAERGIYQYDEGTDRFKMHPFLNTWFEDRHVSKIKEVSKNLIFFIAGGEIGVLKKKSIGVFEIEEKQFKKINRFVSDDLENINVISETQMLIGAKEGFVLYEQEKDQPFQESFHTYLKRVSISGLDDSTQEIDGTFFSGSSLDRSRLMRFSFAAPYFDGVANLKYACRLSPYEDEWSEWSNSSWKEYTNLPAGSYTFEVKALNVYDVESEVSSYPFSIAPRWYESGVAYAGYSLVVLMFFCTVLYTRERKHQTEKLIINQNKEEEIRSKEEEISAFSEKTSQEIQALKNENLEKEIGHKNSQLASVTMHLLSKNEFVMSIRKKLNDTLNSEHDNKESLSKLVKTIDKNIEEDDAWETFAYHFDQVHGNFLQKLKTEAKLTPQETKLCAYLRMNMSTKDIANLMNITIRGVELARYRLRKKLGISREVNLVGYLTEL